MFLRYLLLRQFRNIESLSLQPDPGFNVFWGDNGQGKTNILESIYLLGTLKGFRGNRNEEFVRQGQEACRLEAEVEAQGLRHKIELTISRQGKSPRLDGKESRSANDFFGHLRPVLFSPEEVGLARGYPAGRRALLDRAIFQVNPGYLAQVLDYMRCLKQRNRLLKEQRSDGEIEPWTEALISSGERLREERRRYLERLGPIFRRAYHSIAAGREEADCDYCCAGAGEGQLRGELERCFERERRLGQTLAGPHRDDIEFTVEGRPVRLYGSQGQQRSVILAFKTAQIIDLEGLTGESPVLLLDDMTSELDRHRQAFFFRFLLERRGQVFITTTERESLAEGGLDRARYFRVKEGALST